MTRTRVRAVRLTDLFALNRTGDNITEELMDSFFEAEVEMEKKICRDVVCTSLKDEEGKQTRLCSDDSRPTMVGVICRPMSASGFLRDLCELLLYLLLPPGDFHNKNMRYFLRVSAHSKRSRQRAIPHLIWRFYLGGVGAWRPASSHQPAE